MKIGELAKACNISVRMLRFYEELNLLVPARTQNGYRRYSPKDADYVKKVMLLNHAGLPLKDIALLRDCLHDEPQRFCAALRTKLLDKQKDIERQIEALTQSGALISEILTGEKS
ncbi:MerR family DNA-binding transcriptional regulator [Bisgaard Taxon 10/6]|uniref:MerR family DNA-binding transcriptional regulator n=1 Tax=Exercitatus varius TaxID=67857 RepID=UPI00294B630E|nr:MerR family DNA-binding transcriptional regulator [Exercitatus varius]MDG2915629.1 MerR family DNA-binding transcriptional regulator [Exercitatus varius]MDG2917912.1 MerR family DNA-binding transcriptional regulator [Exercitatus varius]